MTKISREMRVRIWRNGASEDAALAVERAVIAGWTGRDRESLERHIRELEAEGVARPATTPTFYPVSVSRLTTDPAIEVCGGSASGEVEALLLQANGTLLVGVGSDHTDRAAERFDVTFSKQVCDKPLAGEFWLYEDVADHWDRLMLRSWAGTGDETALYQEGPLAALLPPPDLVNRLTGGTALPQGTLMFCGTVAAIGGIRPAPRFAFELEDPVLGRRIRHAYDQISLS